MGFDHGLTFGKHKKTKTMFKGNIRGPKEKTVEEEGGPAKPQGYSQIGYEANYNFRIAYVVKFEIKFALQFSLAIFAEKCNAQLGALTYGFDPSIAPGTGTPSHGGFLYYEILELLDGLTKQGNVIGVDLVEVAPDYDQSGSTTTLAAQMLLNFIGRIHQNRN